MTNPFRPDRVPEPRWLTDGPDDPEGPENYLDPLARKALLELGEDWLDPVDIKALMAKVQGADPDTAHADVLDEAYTEWLKATKAFRDAVLDLYDETVGDD